MKTDHNISYSSRLRLETSIQFAWKSRGVNRKCWMELNTKVNTDYIVSSC